jgi:uncharacterized protein (DUF1499 family)
VRWRRGAVGLGIAIVVVWAARQPVVNDVTTGQSTEYPDLQPRRYPQDPQFVFRAVQSAAGAQRGWKVRNVDPARRTLLAEARVLLTPFTDDLTVRVDSLDGGSQVVMRSHSRVGRGDLGVNARRIRAFFRALDVRLGIHHRDTEAQRKS